MRERISMKSKMLGALALFTLIGALFIMQSAGNSPPTVDAATGTIDALNVGTCLTTDGDVFDGDCGLSQDKDESDEDVAWEVREEVTEVSDLYATYAYDPKTASDEPRVILQDSDLIKISIADTGRDKRTGVLIRGASNEDAELDDDATNALGMEIRDDLEEDGLGFITQNNANAPGTDPDDIDIAFNLRNGTDGVEIHVSGEAADSAIDTSGNVTLNFSRKGNDPATRNPWKFEPMDIDGVIRFYGCVADDDVTACGNNPTFEVLDDIEVDEDASQGNAGGETAPWVGVNASVGAGKDLIILAIYYQTSEMENLIGGETYCYTMLNNDDECTDASDKHNAETNVVYTEDEIDDNHPLVVRAKSDGDQQSVNLHLEETDLFTGRYEGFLRLTDSNGDGKDSDVDPPITSQVDWGREIADGSASDEAGAAVLGVESGPVTIEYDDTDGRTRTLRIEIDNQPPAVQVTNPVHNSASDDHSPDFNGSLEDTDSGLVAESFRLVVDNDSDGEKNKRYVVNGPHATAVTLTQDAVSHAGELEGTFMDEIGMVSAVNLYDLGDDNCGDNDKCHITSDDYDDGDTAATFSDTLRLNLQDGTKGDAETRDAEFEVDFQAYVMDMAGNIGYSDSEPSAPRIINNLGEPEGKRGDPPNVFGYYSAHILLLDEKDPEVIMDQSATGFYGLNADDAPIADRSSVMVAFDGPLDASSISTNTFSVALDKDNDAQITDVDVDGNYVFLKLQDQLASDATPMVSIAEGEGVEDRAGNQTLSNEFGEITVNDGITPQLSVSLSGGSGTGTGDEGPEKLTKNQITIQVESDEDLQGSPRIMVVCSSLNWEKDNVTNDIDDFVANRDGPSQDEPSDELDTTEPPTANTKASGDTYDYTCGYDADDDNFGDDFVPVKVASLNRPGNVWEFTWTQDDTLEDGSITAVAFGRDKSRYMNIDEQNVNSWGSASAAFALDRELLSPMEDGGGDLQPGDGGTSKESRPFILIEFDEGTTVTLDSVELDDVEINDQFEEPNTNRFVYWPATISQGEHEVEVEATDAAGNDVFFEYNFEVVERGDFVIELQAGWNAISVPASPIDTAIGSVFTDAAITTVIGWDTQGWRIAVRRDGVWESNQQYGALNDIQAKYGYWVKSDKFIDQPVALQGPISRNAGSPGSPTGIDTIPGWNFVGVIDQDGDQTEGEFGIGLLSGTTPVTAEEYLGSNYVRAYSWDPTFSRFEVIRPIDVMTIGAGVWVYFEGGIAP